MSTRITLEERRKVVAWIEAFESVRKKFQQRFQKDPPSRRLHETFMRTGSVTNDSKRTVDVPEQNITSSMF